MKGQCLANFYFTAPNRAILQFLASRTNKPVNSIISTQIAPRKKERKPSKSVSCSLIEITVIIYCTGASETERKREANFKADPSKTSFCWQLKELLVRQQTPKNEESVPAQQFLFGSLLEAIRLNQKKLLKMSENRCKIGEKRRRRPGYQWQTI